MALLDSASPEVQSRLAVVLPIAALVVSLFVVYPAWGRYQQIQQEIAAKRVELASMQAEPMPAPVLVNPAATEEPGEPPLFLGDIREKARNSNVDLAGFDLAAPPAPMGSEEAMAQGKSTEPAPPPKAQLVKSVRAKIDVEGSYTNIREFLGAVTNAERLYTVVGLDVLTTRPSTTSGPVIRGTVEIERYVLPNATPSAPPAG